MPSPTVRDASSTQHIDARPVPWVVPVRGVMDLDHVAELRATLLTGIEAAHRERRTDLLVDLTHSSFCDSSGLGALLQARSAAIELGLTLRLAAPSHQMLRLLELTGTEELFPLLEAGPARAACPAAPLARTQCTGARRRSGTAGTGSGDTGTAPRPADPGPVRARPHAPHPSAPEDRPRRRYELAFPHAFDGGEDRVVVRITGRTGAGGHPVYEDASGIVQAEISDRAEVRILATGARQEPPHGVTAHPLA